MSKFKIDDHVVVVKNFGSWFMKGETGVVKSFLTSGSANVLLDNRRHGPTAFTIMTSHIELSAIHDSPLMKALK